ncbi:hypothetical protein B0H13DRAFT_946670 [Mycena leptocephala]|nr:hypothetical protein B0H13DRAFT_946670 [Mycena leptocephala]
MAATSSILALSYVSAYSLPFCRSTSTFPAHGTSIRPPVRPSMHWLRDSSLHLLLYMTTSARSSTGPWLPNLLTCFISSPRRYRWSVCESRSWYGVGAGHPCRVCLCTGSSIGRVTPRRREITAPPEISGTLFCDFSSPKGGT